MSWECGTNLSLSAKRSFRDDCDDVKFAKRIFDYMVEKGIPVCGIDITSGGTGYRITIRTLSGKLISAHHPFEINKALEEVIYNWKQTLDDWQREQLKGLK